MEAHQAEDDVAQEADPRTWRSYVRPVLRWAEHFLAVMGVIFIVYFLCFNLSYMASPSMAPTLQADETSRDWVLTQKTSLWLLNPSRWEIITFRDKEGIQLMKRVVGLPGETISLPDVGKLHIDGKLMDLPERLSFLQYLPSGNLMNGKSAAAGEGWYVLGDYVRDSLDSRYEGPVPRSRIVGRAWLRVWPLSRFGFVR